MWPRSTSRASLEDRIGSHQEPAENQQRRNGEHTTAQHGKAVTPPRPSHFLAVRLGCRRTQGECERPRGELERCQRTRHRIRACTRMANPCSARFAGRKRNRHRSSEHVHRPQRIGVAPGESAREEHGNREQRDRLA
jgi:hypothetical protein